MENNQKNKLVSEQDEFLYNRMQHISGIREEYYGFAKDKYSDFTDGEDTRYNKIIDFVTDYTKKYAKAEAEKKLNEIIFGNTSVEKDLWETGEVEKLGTAIAEGILKL